MKQTQNRSKAMSKASSWREGSQVPRARQNPGKVLLMRTGKGCIGHPQNPTKGTVPERSVDNLQP